MSIKIDCPDCAKETSFFEWSKKPPCNCKNGKIKVYTEKELQEAIKKEREECAKVCDNYDSLYYDKDVFGIAEKCAEAIRFKSKE